MTVSHPRIPRIGEPPPEIERMLEPFRLAAVDLYRDIHKGIRAELFAITSMSANLDSSVRIDRQAITAHVRSVRDVLTSHAHHEDEFIDPVLVDHEPRLAEQVTVDHEQLERRFDGLVALAEENVDAVTIDHRRLTHLLHLELSSFTSAYLAHQYLEERVIMPTLERAIGPDATLAIHDSIVSSIPPEEMARSLSFMLPAMNNDDRIEMLTGIRHSAPAEAFAAVVDLARSVLRTTDVTALEARMVLS